eukprot:6436286-Prymnesium_polylepis.1
MKHATAAVDGTGKGSIVTCSSGQPSSRRAPGSSGGAGASAPDPRRTAKDVRLVGRVGRRCAVSINGLAHGHRRCTTQRRSNRSDGGS